MHNLYSSFLKLEIPPYSTKGPCMVIPLKYNLRSLLNRKVSTALIIVGISLVVMIFVSMMAMAQSMKRAIVQTGCEDNVIIKNKSTASVEYGLLPEEVLNVVKFKPGYAKIKGDIRYNGHELFIIFANGLFMHAAAKDFYLRFGLLLVSLSQDNIHPLKVL